jgi:hypothetical protein
VAYRPNVPSRDVGQIGKPLARKEESAPPPRDSKRRCHVRSGARAVE